jgi:hypothetical protein
MADDFIEADGGVHNIRVMRNRGVNAAQCGLSGQPVFGGPAYYIRNVLYHIPVGIAFKFMAKPAGLMVYHNTVIAENGNRDLFSNVHFRNNQFLGTDAPRRAIAAFPNATAYSSFDYNGYRPNRNAVEQYLWAAPEKGRLRDYDLSRKDFRGYKTLADLISATGQEAHGLEVDYDIFQNLKAPDPARPRSIYHGAGLDFTLKPGSAAVDRGVKLPNINDDFTGQAPDLGAYEVGKPAPIYGPRTKIDQPFYR